MNAPLPAAILRGQPLSDHALRQLFVDARTFNRYTDRPVDDATLRDLVQLLRWGPTAMNTQPGRYVFVRSAEAKQRLKPALSPGNVDKTMVAPVTVIVASDRDFYDHLPAQFPAVPTAREIFAGNAAAAEGAAFRNSSMQGAYLILAARALGLDAGPMSGFDNATLDAEFFPDGRWRSNFLVNLGYGDPSGNYPRGPRLEFDQVARIV